MSCGRPGETPVRPVSPWWSGRGSSPEASDESLLAGLAVGDAAAGAAFVRRFQRRVYGLALSVLSDPSAAEDVAQEALSRAWRHAQAYDPRRGSVATWLLTITRNLAIDVARLRRATPVDPDSLVDFHLGPGADVPANHAVERDEAARVRLALSGLPHDQRRALVLAAYHGCTAREIGELEGVPLGTAKTRIRAGLQKLRGAMQEGEAKPWT